jgi:hypothetical protein
LVNKVGVSVAAFNIALAKLYRGNTSAYKNFGNNMGSPILSYELPTGQVENEAFQIPISAPGSKGD